MSQPHSEGHPVPSPREVGVAAECRRQPMLSTTAVIESNTRVARETFRLRLREERIARALLPGQFVMVRALGRSDPLLARPYALYDTVVDDAGRVRGFEVIYLVLGAGTRALASLPAGAEVQVWGPLGRPFPSTIFADQPGHLLIVAGGVGQTPFLAVAKEMLGQRSYGGGRPITPPRKLTMLYGARSAESFACLEDFEAAGCEPRLATNDGSRGHAGYVTDLLEPLVNSADPPEAFFGCGPEPMLLELRRLAQRYRLRGWVSLETKMACGYGVCFSCVCPIVDNGEWDYRRVCTEGPVFEVDQIAWDALEALPPGR